MIIKMIPETNEEISRFESKGVTEVEHVGVREFCIFGNKIDAEGDLADFHEWHGSYRYLLGSLDFFYQTINDKRRDQGYQPPIRLAQDPSMIKRGGIDSKIQPLDISQLRRNEIPMRPSTEATAFEDEEEFIEEVETINNKTPENKGLRIVPGNEEEE